MNYNYNILRRKNYSTDLNEMNDPYGNNYQGTGILPHSKDDIIKKRREEELEKYKEMWSKDIEIRKQKKLEEKRKKEEMDILEEQRIKKEIEEINKREEQERQEQKEKENNVYKENERLIKNRAKNKNKIIENGMVSNDNKVIDEKMKLVKSESFNYNESLEKLKNKYKNVDLNNIHFYRKNEKYDENKKMIERKLYYNRMKNNIINNKRSVNAFEFAPNPKLLDDSKNPQIARLKKEVNYGYMQISSYMKNLKNNLIEADKNKSKAEKELKFITTEIDKEKKYQLSLDKIEYEKRKNEEPFYNNNYYTNVNDVDPIYYNLMPVNQSNMNDKNQMSNLAKMGQNLIKLSSQSEFIPIGMNYNNNLYKNIGITEQVLLENNIENGEIENETTFQKSED